VAPFRLGYRPDEGRYLGKLLFLGLLGVGQQAEVSFGLPHKGLVKVTVCLFSHHTDSHNLILRFAQQE